MNSRQRRRGRKALLVEALEPRIVLDGQLAHVALDRPPEPDPVAAIERFESADEVRDFLIAGAVKQWEGMFGQPRRPLDGTIFHYFGDGFLDSWASVPRIAADSTVSFDSTNLQVGGVDEGDVVKTDGEYIYVLANNELSIIDARNLTDLALVSQLELDYHVQEIYVTGDRLTTLAQDVRSLPQAGPLSYTEAALRQSLTRRETVLSVYDIADRSSPGLVSSTRLDGSLVSSRRIDDLVYLVTNQEFAYPRVEFRCEAHSAGDTVGFATRSWRIEEPQFYPLPPASEPSCVFESKQAYVARISDSIIESVLPSYEVTQEGELAIGGFLNAPDEIYKPISHDVHNFTSITVIDVNASSAGIVSAATVPTNSSTAVYASAGSIYLTTGLLNEEGGKTQLQQFAIADNGQVELAAVGAVRGTPLNQFSLDEHEGYLRIVTTAGWGEDTRNSLRVLQANEQRLEVVGEIESIAPGERVFATRFLGHEAVVVTFRQIDPLFTIDLGDPANPTIVGELEIPGFSDYLHPISDDLLIGLGQSGANWTSSPQVSLFDVSDFTSPERIDQHIFASDGWTEAGYHHHAFSYFADTQILVIPFTRSSRVCAGYCSPEQSGSFWVLKVDATSEDPLQWLGTVEHDAHVLRSIRIGETLFTVSTESIKATELQSPDVLLDELDFSPIAFPNYFKVDVASQEEVLDVLQNDNGSSNTIIRVGVPTLGGSVTIADDGQSLIYTPPTDQVATIELFTYTIDNGQRTDTATVQVDLTDDSAREKMTALAISDLAELLQIDQKEIDLQYAYRETWPDGCLGVVSPEADCANVPTPGFAVNLETDGGQFQYRTDTTIRVILASADLRLGSDRFETAIGNEAISLDVLANDGLHADLLRIVEVSDAEGELTIAADGKSLLYTPVASTFAVDSFSYTVELADGVTDTAWVSVLVLDDSFEVIEQAAVGVLAAELEIDAESITVVASGILPSSEYCNSFAVYDCRYIVQVGLQYQNRFYVYYAKSAEEMQLNRVFEPEALDDRVFVDVGSIAEIQVLSNDQLVDRSFPELHADPGVITAVSDSKEGGTISFGDETILYTPPENFVGEDVFSYSVGDLHSEVHVHVRGFLGSESLVGIRSQIVNAGGQVVSTLQPGEEAVLQIYVEDLRDDPIRVFSAFLDVEFNPARVAKIVAINYGDAFGNVRDGNAETPGLIDELGAVNFDNEVATSGEQLLASVSFIAGEEGTLTFSTSAPDVLPAHDTSEASGFESFGQTHVDKKPSSQKALVPKRARLSNLQRWSVEELAES